MVRKKWIWAFVLIVFLILILPWAILNWQKNKTTGDDLKIRVRLSSGTVETMNLEEYLIGVVAAEMPAEFEPEALKSQAVAARTYAVKHIQLQQDSKQDYDVDTTVQTQAWISREEMGNRWGFLSYWRYRSKIQDAVEATRGMVLMQNGSYIDAVFYSSSGRKPTERSEDVWGSSRSYLINVSSAEDMPLRFVKKVTFTPAEICQKLNQTIIPKTFKANDFQILTRTAAGRAKTVAVLGKTYQATQLRRDLGLTSTDLEWTIKSNLITITSYGNGHAVGLSQYGANDLARKGAGFQEILQHYYPNTEMKVIAKA